MGDQTQAFSDFFDVHGANIEHTTKIKAVVTRLKVAVTGGINDLAPVDQVIVDGKADPTELGHQGFADFEFSNRTFSGREDTTYECVRRFSCYSGFCEYGAGAPLREKGLFKEDIDRTYSPASMGCCTISPNSGFG